MLHLFGAQYSDSILIEIALKTAFRKEFVKIYITMSERSQPLPVDRVFRPTELHAASYVCARASTAALSDRYAAPFFIAREEISLIVRDSL